jgi:hypothetical protein
MGIAIQGSKKLGLGEICKKAKLTRLPFTGKPPRAIRRLGRIYFDLAGGGKTLEDPEDLTPTFGGAKYFLVITDDATRYRWIFLLKNKSDTYEAIRNWLCHMRNLIGRCPALAVFNEGGEFDNKHLNKVFKEFGVEYSPTTPHTQQHNGVSKRSIRTLCEFGRALLIEASLDKKL